MNAITASPVILQLCPFSPYLAGGLADRAQVVAWHELSETEQAAWLAQHAASVTAVATGGHLG